MSDIDNIAGTLLTDPASLFLVLAMAFLFPATLLVAHKILNGKDEAVLCADQDEELPSVQDNGSEYIWELDVLARKNQELESRARRLKEENEFLRDYLNRHLDREFSRTGKYPNRVPMFTGVKDPPKGWITVCVDGSVRHDHARNRKYLGAGAVLVEGRDVAGQYTHSVCVDKDLSEEADLAEISAVLLGLIVAHQECAPGVQILSDSQTAIKTFRICKDNKLSPEDSDKLSLLGAIKRELDALPEGAVMEWLPRALNYHAHNTAQEASKLSATMHAQCHPGGQCRELVRITEEGRTGNWWGRKGPHRIKIGGSNGEKLLALPLRSSMDIEVALPRAKPSVRWLLRRFSGNGVPQEAFDVLDLEHGEDVFMQMSSRDLMSAIRQRHGENAEVEITGRLRARTLVLGDGYVHPTGRDALVWCARGLTVDLALKKIRGKSTRLATEEGSASREPIPIGARERSHDVAEGHSCESEEDAKDEEPSNDLASRVWLMVYVSYSGEDVLTRKEVGKNQRCLVRGYGLVINDFNTDKRIKETSYALSMANDYFDKVVLEAVDKIVKEADALNIKGVTIVSDRRSLRRKIMRTKTESEAYDIVADVRPPTNSNDRAQFPASDLDSMRAARRLAKAAVEKKAKVERKKVGVAKQNNPQQSNSKNQARPILGKGITKKAGKVPETNANVSKLLSRKSVDQITSSDLARLKVGGQDILSQKPQEELVQIVLNKEKGLTVQALQQALEKMECVKHDGKIAPRGINMLRWYARGLPIELAARKASLPWKGF